MQTAIKIGIVEDELIIAEKIKLYLLEMGYYVCEPTTHYHAALAMIEKDRPDILLLDINLKDEKDGIELAEKINEKYQLPFIFLTANSDPITIDRAKRVNPNAYIVKPFNKEELFAAIEIAFNNYSTAKDKGHQTHLSPPAKDFIFIREGNRFIKLLFNEIVYIESCENYVFIHTRDKGKTMIRSTFSDFLKQLPEGKFYRTHRSFAVQINLVEHIEPTEVFASKFKIPISNTYRQGLFMVLGIKE